MATKNLTTKPVTMCSVCCFPWSQVKGKRSAFTFSHKPDNTVDAFACTSWLRTPVNALSRCLRRTGLGSTAPRTAVTFSTLPELTTAENAAFANATALRLRFATRQARKTTFSAGSGINTDLIKPLNGALSVMKSIRSWLDEPEAQLPGVQTSTVAPSASSNVTQSPRKSFVRWIATWPPIVARFRTWSPAIDPTRSFTAFKASTFVTEPLAIKSPKNSAKRFQVTRAPMRTLLPSTATSASSFTPVISAKTVEVVSATPNSGYTPVAVPPAKGTAPFVFIISSSSFKDVGRNHRLPWSGTSAGG
mmetsp:Transcript_28533/g.71707  ORF Transcript_28533/g.71707 Transcript_28533/m.71707 type:complete len:305 (+) Transcript_28533:2937-3851(+)